MILPLLLGATALWFAVLRPNAPLNGLSPLKSSTPSPLPPTVDPHMVAGASYAFSAASTLSATDFQNELETVGALITAPGLIPGVGFAGFTGTFQWHGEDGEPTENLPGITWLTLDALPQVIPAGALPASTTVSGYPYSHSHEYSATSAIAPSGDFLSRRAAFMTSIGEDPNTR